MTVLVQYATQDDERDAQRLARAARNTLSTPVDLLETSAEPSEPGGVLFREHDAVFVVGGQRANPTYAFLENAGIVEKVTPSRTEVIGNGIVRDPETGTETPTFALAGNTRNDTDKLISAMTNDGEEIATQAVEVSGLRALVPGVDPFDAINNNLRGILDQIARLLPGGVRVLGVKTEPEQDKVRFFFRTTEFTIDSVDPQLVVSGTTAVVLTALGSIGVGYTVADVLNLFTGNREVAEAPPPDEIQSCREKNDTDEEINDCLEDKIETGPGRRPPGGGGGGPVEQIEQLLVLGIGGAILLQVSQEAF